MVEFGLYYAYEVKCYGAQVHWLSTWSAYPHNCSVREWLWGMTEMLVVSKNNGDLSGSFTDKKHRKRKPYGYKEGLLMPI